jgi:hypothetical protein
MVIHLLPSTSQVSGLFPFPCAVYVWALASSAHLGCPICWVSEKQMHLVFLPLRSLLPRSRPSKDYPRSALLINKCFPSPPMLPSWVQSTPMSMLLPGPPSIPFISLVPHRH